jgi:hypothetical protein
LASNGVYITLLPSLKFVAGKIQSLFSNKKCAACHVQPTTADLARLAILIEEKAVTAPVVATFPVADLQKALENLNAGGVRGKIGIVIEG